MEYLQSLDVNTESFSVSEFKKQAGFLQDMFRADFTPDIKQLIEDVPDIDEGQLIEAEKSLSEQADEMGVSVYQMLEQFSQDEDEEIREQAVVLKKYIPIYLK